MYEKDMTVWDTVDKIIRMSHNTRKETQPLETEKGVLKCFEEAQGAEEYADDLIDPRAAQWPRDGDVLIDLFRRYGMQNIRPASGAPNESQIPELKEWLRVDYNEAHPWLRDDDGKAVMGCPKLFFFDGLTQAAQDELNGMPLARSGVGIIDKRYPHDFIDTAKYWASSKPAWDGLVRERSEDETGTTGTVNPYTKY